MTDARRRHPIRLTELTDAAAARRSSAPTCWPTRWPGSARRPRPEELIAGLDPPDDAAVYRVSDDLAIIGTLDFFPPLVDDPRTYGEIAAANALSDVFAMGGRVLFALSIAAFPEDLPRDALAEIFAGASAKVREAGGILAGGHTIRDPEPKYGLAVIGAAHPDQLLRKGGARAGRLLAPDQAPRDRPARQRPRQGRTSDEDLGGDRRNADAESRRLRGPGRARVRAATDVTGFGLLGHGLEMARASGARFVFDARRCRPSGALELARPGSRPAAPPTTALRGASARRPTGRAGARRAGARSTDLGWPARGGPPGGSTSHAGAERGRRPVPGGSEACRPGSRESR